MVKFSVIIPTYQRPELLHNTLRFLNRQNEYLDATEVIVIDHGSQDQRSEEVVSSFQPEFTLNYIRIPRARDNAHNASVPRNAGIDYANGEILIFLDDDILVNENFLQEHARYHQAADNLVVVGLRKLLDPEASSQLVKNPNSIALSSIPHTLEERYRLFDIYSYNMTNLESPWQYVYSFNMSVRRKELKRDNIHFDENFQFWGMEDIELAYNLFTHGYRILVNHRLEVAHQYHRQANEDEIVYVYRQEINNEYFKKKHGFTIAVSGKKHEQHNMWAYQHWVKLFRIGGKVFILKDGSKANQLKRVIMRELAEERDYLIFIIDQAGSDLDLWVQLLENNSKYPVLYYPDAKNVINNSKLFDKGKIEEIVL